MTYIKNYWKRKLTDNELTDEVSNMVNKMIESVSCKDTFISRTIKIGLLFENNLYVEPSFNCNYTAKSKVAIIGEPGQGKSLFLIKQFLVDANKFLNKETIKLPIYVQLRDYEFKDYSLKELKTNTLISNLIDLGYNFQLYLDGLDEIKKYNDKRFKESEIVRHAKYLTVRKFFYNKNCVDLAFFPLVIPDWDNKNIELFVENYANLNGKSVDWKQEHLRYLINSSIVLSPFLCSLYLFNKKQNSGIKTDVKTSYSTYSIMRTFVNEYAKKECMNLCFDSSLCSDVEDIAYELAWHFFHSNGQIKAKEIVNKIIENKKTSIIKNSKLDKGSLKIIIDRLLSFLFRDEGRLFFSSHESLFEFLIASYIIRTIQKKVKNFDILSTVLKYDINQLITTAYEVEGDALREKAFNWFLWHYKTVIRDIKNVNEKKTYMSSSAKNKYRKSLLILNQIFFRLPRTSYFPGITDFITRELQNDNHPILQISMYDGFVQYGQGSSIRNEFEIILYNKFDDEQFVKWYIGCNQIYYDKLDAIQMLSEQGYLKEHSFLNSLEAIIRHYRDNDEAHQYLKRIEIKMLCEYLRLTPKELISEDFFKRLKIFIQENEESIIHACKTEFGSKVFKEFILLKNTVNQCSFKQN